ncbi:MAG: GH25 family lysozyme [Spirosomataceae bacterium]
MSPKRPQKAFWQSSLFKWIAGAIVAMASLAGAWYFYFGNFNQWTHSFKAGIRLPMRYSIHGIDVSKFQGDINWKQVVQMELPDNSRLRFVFIKSTEGATLIDKRFQKNFKGAKQAHLVCGAYHFYIPWRDPVKQANNFVANVKLQSGDFPPVLDVELNSLRPDKEIVRDIHTWLKLVENHYGKKPIIYTNEHFYFKFVKGHFDDYPLWIADYSSEHLQEYPHNTLYFWQHSKDGWVEGIKGRVDFNACLKSESEFEELLIR